MANQDKYFNGMKNPKDNSIERRRERARNLANGLSDEAIELGTLLQSNSDTLTEIVFTTAKDMVETIKATDEETADKFLLELGAVKMSMDLLDMAKQKLCDNDIAEVADLLTKYGEAMNIFWNSVADRGRIDRKHLDGLTDPIGRLKKLVEKLSDKEKEKE